MNEKNIGYPASLLDLLDELEQKGATAAEKATAMERYIEYKARINGVPMRGTLELTPLCNLDCKMCYVHLNKNQLANDCGSILSGKQWISIIEQAIENGLTEVTLTGGEALLHPDFEEIFLFLTTNNISINLKTNGVLLTEERIRFFEKHHLSGIQISLYGSNNDTYEAVTGHRSFDQVIHAITLLKDTHISLEVIITPSKYIWHDIEPLLKLVDSINVKYTVNPGLIEPFEETGRSGQDHDLTLEQYIELNKLRAKLSGVIVSPSCIDEIPFIGGTNQNSIKGLKCAAGRSVFCVTWRGTVLPCRSLENINFNGLTTRFSDGWKKINSAVKEYPIPMECEGCEFENVCPSCVVQHERGAMPGHANSAICYRAQRLAEEGFIKKLK